MIDKNEVINLIDQGLWDHYSGLPNPLWYQNKKEVNNEEDNTDDTTDLGIDNKKI